jgi:peptidoglycan hydrolase-like protein with peptidoglycan-binding domain
MARHMRRSADRAARRVAPGSAIRVRTAADAVLPKPRDEKAWVERYIGIRRAWLAGNANPSLPPTVYRMVELQRLADAGNWMLDPPITVRGITITAASFDDAAVTLAGETPAGGSAQSADEIVLMLRAARMTGTSVTLVQRALVDNVLMRAEDADGVFGPRTARLVKRFQRTHGLAVYGIVGPSTWACIRDLPDSTAGPAGARLDWTARWKRRSSRVDTPSGSPRHFHFLRGAPRFAARRLRCSRPAIRHHPSGAR